MSRIRDEDFHNETLEQRITQVRFANLDPNGIPAKFHHLIKYAQHWGIDDVRSREINIDKSSDQELENFVSKIAPFDELLDEWLAGSEAYSEPISKEYVAYSCMRLACDSAKLNLKWRRQDRENRDKLQLKLPLKENKENGS